jgi:hypothetical protein
MGGPLAPGTRLGPVEIDAVIGAGMSRVYRPVTHAAGVALSNLHVAEGFA